MSELLVPVVVGGIVGALYIISLGANDVANALGTSVGSKALSLKSACILGGIFELLGATLVGGKTANALAAKFLEETKFSSAQYSYGMMSALFGSMMFTVAATKYALPVSSTHAVIGALVAIGIVEHGGSSVDWTEVGLTSLSWVLSPAAGLLFSFTIYKAILKFVLDAPGGSLSRAALAAPFLNAGTFATLVCFTMVAGPTALHPSSGWATVGLTVLSFGISFACFRFLVLPYMQRKGYLVRRGSLDGIEHQMLTAAPKDSFQVATEAPAQEQLKENAPLAEENGAPPPSDSVVKMKPAEQYFILPMVMTAACVAFGHGGNDVGNAIGPFSACLYVYENGSLKGIESHETPILVTFFGGLGIVVGLSAFGKRVIETVGEKITRLTFSKGFAAQYGASVAVLICTSLGLPISTTSVLVGSIAGVGYADGGKGVDLKVLKRIVAGWLVTLPASGIISAIIYGVCKLGGI